MPCVPGQPAFESATEAAQFEDCDWSPLFVTGTSGIILFVLALAWWRSRLDMTGVVGEAYNLWIKGVNDVIVAFKAVVEYVDKVGVNTLLSK